MEKTSVTIIGAGIVGLAVASEISKRTSDLFILERNSDIGMETSSRNSEVVHAGLYYPYDSLKRELCIEGNRYTYEICKREQIDIKKIGKYVIAKGEEEENELEILFQNAKKNGVPEMAYATKEQVLASNPALKLTSAIFSGTTGIVDSHSMMKYFLLSARSNGADISYNTEVTAIEKCPSGGYFVTVKENNGENFTYISECLINCAGLRSDEVSEYAGIDVDKNGYRLHYCRGDYFRLKKGTIEKVNNLIYPAVKTDSVSLGIHMTPDLAGGLRFGPDAEYIGRDIDYTVDESKRKKFRDSVVEYLPGIKEEDLYPDTCGVRPKLQAPGEGFKDFIIKEEIEHNLKDFINLVGIDSPGLTSAPAIAKMVYNIVYGSN